MRCLHARPAKELQLTVQSTDPHPFEHSLSCGNSAVHKIMENGQAAPGNVHINHQNGEKCDFDSGVIVGARQTGLSIYITADLLKFLVQQQSLAFTQNGAIKKKHVH